MLRSCTFQIAALAGFSICSATAVSDETVYVENIPLSVSKSEAEKLRAVNDVFDEQMDSLKEAIRSSQNQLVEKKFARDGELESLLSEQQKSTLRDELRDEQRRRAAATAKFLRQFAYLSTSIADADQLDVLEGLPRASTETLDRTGANSDTVEIDGWDFYSKPLELTPAVSNRLRMTLLDYASFQPYSGGKFCGGFHPDFCVQWKYRGASYHALVCLGCNEILYVVPNGRAKFDYESTAWKAFAQIAIRTFVRHKDTIVRLDKTRGQ
jgi:hypothetical protein